MGLGKEPGSQIAPLGNNNVTVINHVFSVPSSGKQIKLVEVADGHSAPNLACQYQPTFFSLKQLPTRDYVGNQATGRYWRGIVIYSTLSHC